MPTEDINQMDIITLVIEVLIFSALIGTIATTVAGGSNLSGASLVLYLKSIMLSMGRRACDNHNRSGFHRLSFKDNGSEERQEMNPAIAVYQEA